MKLLRLTLRVCLASLQAWLVHWLDGWLTRLKNPARGMTMKTTKASDWPIRLVLLLLLVCWCRHPRFVVILVSWLPLWLLLLARESCQLLSALPIRLSTCSLARSPARSSVCLSGWLKARALVKPEQPRATSRQILASRWESGWFFWRRLYKGFACPFHLSFSSLLWIQQDSKIHLKTTRLQAQSPTRTQKG